MRTKQNTNVALPTDDSVNGFRLLLCWAMMVLTEFRRGCTGFRRRIDWIPVMSSLRRWEGEESR